MYSFVHIIIFHLLQHILLLLILQRRDWLSLHVRKAFGKKVVSDGRLRHNCEGRKVALIVHLGTYR
jgi:hypothetical protein